MNKAQELIEELKGQVSEAAPSGATVSFENQMWKKGHTDQPTWFPVNPGKGLQALIPEEDDTYFPKIEAEWAKQEKEGKAAEKTVADFMKKRKEAIAKLTPEQKAQLDKIQLDILKAPISKKQQLHDKYKKFLGL